MVHEGSNRDELPVMNLHGANNPARDVREPSHSFTMCHKLLLNLVMNDQRDS
jgi:hypothetical protein